MPAAAAATPAPDLDAPRKLSLVEIGGGLMFSYPALSHVRLPPSWWMACEIVPALLFGIGAVAVYSGNARRGSGKPTARLLARIAQWRPAGYTLLAIVVMSVLGSIALVTPAPALICLGLFMVVAYALAAWFGLLRIADTLRSLSRR